MKDYSDSIIQNDKRYACWICGRECYTHKHHIFGGANRKLSERFGLYVHLCPEDHNMSDRGVHFNKELARYLHEVGQMTFEKRYREEHGASEEDARREFMKLFGKNYL